MGTATTPRAMQPRKAATHSPEFSPHSTTRLPDSNLAALELRRKSPRGFDQPGVGPTLDAITAAPGDRDIGAWARFRLKVFEHRLTWHRLRVSLIRERIENICERRGRGEVAYGGEGGTKKRGNKGKSKT
jgi:hypothetical protein